MGIPSYFSYLVRNHNQILKKINTTLFPKGIHHLYLDCNSIVYDVVHSIDFQTILPSQHHMTIFQHVVHKINEYIHVIQPSHKVLIAFDGVAPVAKLNQQRTRRYKSWYQTKVMQSIHGKITKDVWNTTAITPGTPFMKELNDYIQHAFASQSIVEVTTSNDVGEGEHKIFQYIRQYPEKHKDATTIIYGLDADLIMLSLTHLPIQNQNNINEKEKEIQPQTQHQRIYLFRETPEFIKSIDSTLEPNEQYVLDIPLLSSIISSLMQKGENDTQERLYDYLLLCFFLGNDFLPHFPAVNIRTGGVDKMLNAYKAIDLHANEVLTDGKIIYWNHVFKLIHFFANNEETFLKTETRMRDRNEKKIYPTTTPEEKLIKFDALPTYDRGLEKYINPYQTNWQQRYYWGTMKIDATKEEEIQKICFNYLQGLEWTFKYYTKECPDWRWSYEYHYPPLFQDLQRYTPLFSHEYFPSSFQSLPAVHPYVQLCYVLPRTNLQYLPSLLQEQLLQKFSHWYPNEAEFIWAYCKYFWEAHIDLPCIDINELTKLIDTFQKTKQLL